jgi:hypothetical protein
MKLAVLAFIGLVLAVGLTTAATELTSQRIGLQSEPLSAGERLAPRETARPRRSATPKPKPKPTATVTAEPAPSAAATEEPEVDDDSSGRGRGRGRGRGGGDDD